MTTEENTNNGNENENENGKNFERRWNADPTFKIFETIKNEEGRHTHKAVSDKGTGYGFSVQEAIDNIKPRSY